MKKKPPYVHIAYKRNETIPKQFAKLRKMIEQQRGVSPSNAEIIGIALEIAIKDFKKGRTGK